MSELSRREILRRAAATLAAGSALDQVAAQQIHRLTSAAAKSGGGAYKPKALTGHEYRTLERLTDLIIPTENGAPGALAAGAAAWIDMLATANDKVLAIYTGGLAWLDRAMQRRGTAADFVSAPASDQHALLDLIAYRKNDSPELGPGIAFFEWARRMTVDAFYTSEVGIKDLDYRGNTPSASFEVPAEAIRYVLRGVHEA